MKVKIEDWKIDLGQTPIENMFLNSYMLTAPGDAVKAYLYGYKIAFEKGEPQAPEDMAAELGISENELNDIWTYWEEMGLIGRRDDAILFYSLRQLYLGVDRREDYFAEPEALVKDAENPHTKMMIEQIESVLTVKLRPNQVAALLTALREYPIEKEVAVMSFTYAFHTLNTKDFDYALGVWRKWYIAGVRTMEQLESHLQKEKDKEKNKDKSGKGVKSTGFTTRGQGQERLSDEDVRALVEKKLKNQRKGRNQ